MITNGWTLYNADGFLDKSEIAVQTYDDGTVRIGGTLHRADELVMSESRIESTVAGWYLVK